MEVQSTDINHLKLELKKFEVNFVKEKGRKPTKVDISHYPDIKFKYEKYSYLKKSYAGESCTIPAKEQRKVLSTIGNDANPPKSTVSEDVWGSSLLRKNMVKAVCTDDEEFKENAKIKEDPPTFDWRSKLRKNISTRVSLKDLKKRTSLSQSTINEMNTSFQSDHAESKIIITNFTENNEDDPPGENSYLTASITNTCADDQISTIFATPLSLAVKKKQTFHVKPVRVENFEAEDLSDLNSLSQDDGLHEKMDSCLNMSSENAFEDPKSFEKEADSFIESKFRDRKQNSSFNPSETASFSYDDVCLFTRSASSDINDSEGAEESAPPADTNTGTDGSPKKEDSSSVSGPAKTAPKGNYVALNMKKKTFSRKGNSGVFLRKQIYRQKLAKKGYSFKGSWKGKGGGSGTRLGGSGLWKKNFSQDKGEDKCFKCGKAGHWANQCKGFRNASIPTTQPEETESLEEILDNIDIVTASLNGEAPSRFMNKEISVSVAEPFFEDFDLDLTDNKDVMDALKMFKYTSFRPGQEIAIRRILNGQSTLLVLATGSGKSLCYQLPAYLYATQRKAITLVISPLVSLMDDQVRGLPRMMKAARIHSGMNKEQRDKTLLEVESGKIHVLLISPEAITTWAGMSPKYSPLMRLPPISFACIDECHCLSEWSHSFRPSYLRVCQVLKDRLQIKCLVGLTATATMDTCASVARQLGIVDPREGIIAKIDIPENLILSASKDRYKDEALAELLIGERFSQLDSVIVYCSRRDEAARIAALLRIKMMDVPALQRKDNETVSDEEAVTCDVNTKKRKRKNGGKTSKRKVVTLDAECYHAGMSAAERRRIQNKFMNGSLRVVVATVAFGMGIDKQDVRSVIHYNMPMSFERYVQEVGRAGRDGKPAHCHVFLDADGKDLSELGRHCYGKTIDRYVIKKFVKKVFVTCKCEDGEDKHQGCNGHGVAIDIDDVTEDLDVKREGLETLLCYLEIEGLIEVYLPTETRCAINFYDGPGQMVKTVKRVKAVAVALKLKGTVSDKTSLEFDVMKLADQMNMELSALKKMLRYLTYDTSLSTADSGIEKSGIEVQFSHPSFCLRTLRKATDEFLDSITEFLHKRVIAQENKEIDQLKMCFDTLKKFSYSNVGLCRDSTDRKQSAELKNVITKYFRERNSVSDQERCAEGIDPAEVSDLRSLIRQFLAIYGNDLGSKLTGRAVARILHGIDSLRYSAKMWGSVRRFWRAKLHIDFNYVRRVATEEILASRT